MEGISISSKPVENDRESSAEPHAEVPSFVGSRGRKATMNSAAAALEYGTRLLASFVVKPVLVSGLGAFGYGTWEVLGRLAGQLGPAAGQAGHALRWTVAHHQSSQDFEKKRRTVGSAIAVWALLLPVCVIASFLIAWLLPDWLDAPADAAEMLRLTALLLGANVAMMSLVEIPKAVLEGENLGYKRMGFSALLIAVGGVLAMTVVWLGFGLVGLAASTLLTSICTGLFFLFVVQKSVHWFGVLCPTWSSIRHFFGLSRWFLTWQMVLQLIRASDVILLGVFASVELVTVYSLTKYAPETAINLVAIVVFGVTPGLGGIIGAGDLTKATQIRTEILSLTWLIATTAGGTALLWNQSFLNLWVGQEFDAGMTSTLLLVVMVTQFVLLRSDANIIDLTLELRAKVRIGFLAALISVVLAAVLVGYFELGIVGLCVGMIVGRLVLNVAYPWIVGRYLGIHFFSQARRAVRPGLLSILVFLLASSLAAQLSVISWASLVAWVAGTALILPMPLFFFGLNKEIRSQLTKRIYGLFETTRSGADKP